jgi:hypothetical protein
MRRHAEADLFELEIKPNAMLKSFAEQVATTEHRGQLGRYLNRNLNEGL